jgi:CrcB protein
MTWIAIAIGGAVGSVLRHAVNMLAYSLMGHTVPAAVAMVNITGCLVIGGLTGLIAIGRWTPGQSTSAFVFAGILAGFTTFSSFGLDTFTLVREGRSVVAALNVIGQVTVGVMAVFVGYALVTR